MIEAAIPLMKHYKRKGVDFSAEKFDLATFDREKPFFCQLWGPAGDQFELASKLSDEPMVELLAYVGPTLEGYPLLMLQVRFEAEYELD